MSIRVETGGLLTTVQDSGRFGFQKYGVLASGAMDTAALRLANLLAGNHGVQDYGGAVDKRELVVARGESSPLLHMAEPALDDIAPAVISDGASAARAAPFPMPLLVRGFRDHAPDATFAQVHANRPRGVDLVSSDGVGSRSRTPNRSSDAQLFEQGQEHRRVTCLPWGDLDHQGKPASIHELVDLGREAAPGAADRVVRRLDARILVIR